MASGYTKADYTKCRERERERERKGDMEINMNTAALISVRDSQMLK
jgi:hypothetical protein